MGEYLEEDVLIIGAGIAGLATALALKRVGVAALVLERSNDLRAHGAALTLFPNAWFALDALGVSQKLTQIYPPFIKGCVTNIGTGATQEISFSGTNKNGSGPRCVHRKVLLKALAEELPVDSIRFSCKFISIETKNQDNSTFALVSLEDGTIIKAKVLIGCDGVHSKVARWLGLSEPVSSGRWAVRGLAVYPEGHGFNHEVRQFVDVGKRIGFVPINDTEIYWFITFQIDSEGELGEDPKLIQELIINNYAKDLPLSYINVIEHSDLSTLTLSPLVFRYPWNVVLGNTNKLNVTLAGDSMHPMTPDLGQGGCAALEDAVVLGRHIGESFIQHGKIVPTEVAGVLGRYVKERRWRAAGLITGSYLSGWAQQNGSGWFMKFIRDVVFYRILYNRMISVTHFDCGKLPLPSSTHELKSNYKLE